MFFFNKGGKILCVCVHTHTCTHTFTVLCYFRLILFIDVYVIFMSGYLVFVVCFPSVSLQLIACAQNAIFCPEHFVWSSFSSSSNLQFSLVCCYSVMMYLAVSCAHQMLIVDRVLWSCLKVNFFF